MKKLIIATSLLVFLSGCAKAGTKFFCGWENFNQNNKQESYVPETKTSARNNRY